VDGGKQAADEHRKQVCYLWMEPPISAVYGAAAEIWYSSW